MFSIHEFAKEKIKLKLEDKRSWLVTNNLQKYVLFIKHTILKNKIVCYIKR